MPSRANAKVRANCPVGIYNNRNRIERFWARIKEYRAVATRYDKTAGSFRAGVLIAAAIDWIKTTKSKVTN